MKAHEIIFEVEEINEFVSLSNWMKANVSIVFLQLWKPMNMSCDDLFEHSWCKVLVVTLYDGINCDYMYIDRLRNCYKRCDYYSWGNFIKYNKRIGTLNLIIFRR